MYRHPGTGVNRVLERWTESRDGRRIAWNRAKEWKRIISRNDKGITQASNDLGNPPCSAWEARTLPLSYARAGLNPTPGISPSQERLCVIRAISHVPTDEAAVNARARRSLNGWP